jgi:23S rRNA (cytosine1962-C5)-methyltransferase
LSDILSSIPRIAEKRIALRVTPEAARAITRGHPWLFESAITQQSFAGRPGDLAVIFDKKRRFLAIGLFDPHSPIRVRILQAGKPVSIGQEWFQEKIISACNRRTPLLAQPAHHQTTGCRLVHGENDGLPGLVLDRYENTLVIKLYTPAWLPHLRDILPALPAADRIILRFSRRLATKPQDLFGLEEGMVISGTPLDGQVMFWENGLRFEADPIRGQKTGFYFDQRDNRTKVERLTAGFEVLNVFAYTGGFSVYAARGGARRVISVDLSAAALAAARRNWAHNRHIPPVRDSVHTTLAEDAFESLARLAAQGDHFDMIILDPPAFAQKQKQVDRALAAYRRLTILGLSVLKKEGILVQASCSSRVAAEDFFKQIHLAAVQADRPLVELARTGHALDHPISYPEGAYLKCLFAKAA